MSEGYRPEYLAGLNLLARVCSILTGRGLPAPVLVGGAVVEFDTAGQIHTGDFDVLCPVETELREALLAVGFVEEDRPRRLRGGFYHKTLPMGLEVVSGAYFDGHGDRGRIRLVAMPEGDVPMAPTEEMIADRLGQWVASNRRDGEMLLQAKTMFALASDLSHDYLDQRIRQDTAGALTLAEFISLDVETHYS